MCFEELLGGPPKIAVLTAGYKGLFRIVKNKVNVNVKKEQIVSKNK